MRTIKFKNVFDAIDQLEKLYADHFFEVWTPDDFDNVNDQSEEKLTHQQHVAIAEIIKHKRDCEAGINWDFIQQCIKTIKEK